MPSTSFDPQIHGFAFNNTWLPDETEKQIFNRITLAAILLDAGILLSLNRRALKNATRIVAAQALPLGLIIASTKADLYTYGLCGGISFTALDYFKHKRDIPWKKNSVHPTRQTSSGKILRNYIWKRTLDSLRANSLTVLNWMAITHLYPNGKYVRDKMTRVELDRLKNYIDSGTPWPLGLIGTTKSPFNNHQVLATGYKESSKEIVVTVYDSNCPTDISTIKVTFGIDAPTFVESCSSVKRGPLQGLFCETYKPALPPQI